MFLIVEITEDFLDEMAFEFGLKDQISIYGVM